MNFSKAWIVAAGRPEKQQPFWKKQESGRVHLSDARARNNINEIREKAILSLCGAISQIHQAQHDLLADMIRQLHFYRGALSILKYMESYSIAHVFPEFCEEPRICADGVYDLSYALYLKSQNSSLPVIGNALDSAGCNVFFVTGPNHGGKTTFLRSIGICQLFAQCGLPVQMCIRDRYNILY